jgi:PAS domain S-box-containing protein
MTTHLTFTQLVDIKQIQQLMEAHYRVTGVCTGILDADENILVSVGWQDICCSFHRAHPAAAARCRESDAYIKAHVQDINGSYVDYQCRNGLRDVAMPIIIAGEHLATFFVGQFFYDVDEPDETYFRNQAKEFGFDETGYLEALSRVPVRSHEEIRNIMDYYRNLVKVMAGMGLKNLELVREVEERQRAENEASFFRTLIEYTRDPVYVLDPADGYRIVYVNQAACSHYGMDREHLLTLRIPDWDPVFDMENIDVRQQEMRQGKSMRFETLHRVASGDIVPVEVTANYLVHNGKELSAGYFYDISQRKAMEAALKESERNLIEAQRIARVGNWASDLSGNILSASGECRRIFGLEPMQLAGKFETFLEMVQPVERDSVRSAIETMLKNHLPCSFECAITRPGGIQATVQVNGEVVSDDLGNPVRLVGTVQDITEQRRVMESLREKDMLLVQQSRLAAMGEMINYIAHQWRQPLNTIGVLVQAMRDDYQDGECDDGYIELMVIQIMDLIQHMSCTIDDFRDFFRTASEERRFNLKEITCKTMSFLSPAMKADKIEVSLEADDNLMTKGHPNEFAHVLLNILNNAREALIERHVESPRIYVRVCRDGEKAVVTIRDNAGGIPPNLIGRVFDAYFTTKGKGTGIGLYMAKTIIEKRMKGCITVNNLGEGAEFRIEL